MQVLVNSDHHIVGGKDLTERVQGVVEGRLDRFEGRIARVVVHLSDLNGSRRGDRAALLGERDARKTLRCLMEARVGGLRPIAVSHEAPTITQAIHVAADKLERALEHTFGKLEETSGRMPPEGQIASIEALQQLERTEADHR